MKWKRGAGGRCCHVVSFSLVDDCRSAETPFYRCLLIFIVTVTTLCLPILDQFCTRLKF